MCLGSISSKPLLVEKVVNDKIHVIYRIVKYVVVSNKSVNLDLKIVYCKLMGRVGVFASLG